MLTNSGMEKKPKYLFKVFLYPCFQVKTKNSQQFKGWWKTKHGAHYNTYLGSFYLLHSWSENYNKYDITK